LNQYEGKIFLISDEVFCQKKVVYK
jgi:hypothetical protein